MFYEDFNDDEIEIIEENFPWLIYLSDDPDSVLETPFD